MAPLCLANHLQGWRSHSLSTIFLGQVSTVEISRKIWFKANWIQLKGPSASLVRMWPWKHSCVGRPVAASGGFHHLRVHNYSSGMVRYWMHVMIRLGSSHLMVSGLHFRTFVVNILIDIMLCGQYLIIFCDRYLLKPQRPLCIHLYICLHSIHSM